MVEAIAPLIATARAGDLLALLATLEEKERRVHAGPVREMFRLWYAAATSFGAAAKSPPAMRDADALKVAMLATATRAELKPYRFLVVPQSLPLVDVMRALTPSWIDGWVEDLIEHSPFLARNLAPLWRAGLCRRPQGDSVILAYYAHHSGRDLAGDPDFLREDVWRFFEVEGGGEFSLAAHDKYSQPAAQWSTCLLALAAERKLDRQRLLDASLDALERDFGQFRAGWYSRFHAALAPSPAEQAARCDRYLHLLASAVPPTVSLALKTLKALDKAGKIPVEDLLAEIRPALLSRHKSAALAALQLLASAAKRVPGRADEIAVIALSALVSETADVQEKVLDLVDGQTGAPAVQTALAEYRDIVAPSVRGRISRLIAKPDQHAPIGEQKDEPKVVAVATFAPVRPCASLDEALAAFLSVLENPRDPLAVERAVDGLARFGAASPPDSPMLSPLAKRARQIFDKADDQRIKLALAACGRAWCGDGMPGELLNNRFGSASLATTFIERCDEIIARIRHGQALPLLSLPSDESGQVDPADLVDRLEPYRSAGVTPGPVDLALALTRLRAEGRERYRDRVDRTDETGRVVAFALGAGGTAAGVGPLWGSAWLARAGDGGQVPAAWPSTEREPDGGIAAQYTLTIEENGSQPHIWYRTAVATAPALKKPNPRQPGSLLHYRSGSGWSSGTACGHVAADIAWSSLVRPGDAESFLANAIGALDTYQKLTDHYCIAYLDPFDRLNDEPGAMGYAVLAYYLASEDQALCAHVRDKLSVLIEGQRISAARLASAILPFMLLGPYPSMRWTRNLATLAETTPRHRAFAREVVADLMCFEPTRTPRDIGGMIELLYQLQVDCGKPFDNARAIACLQRLDGGGKIAKFSGKLLSLRPC